jgi:uncharacterized protein (DUF433 family)
MSIVQDPEHSDGAPTIEGTGIRVKDVAVAYEHSGYEPDEIIRLYPLAVDSPRSLRRRSSPPSTRGA